MAVATIALTQARLDRRARHVPLDAPWTAARAAEWDAMSVGQWIGRCGVRAGIARDLFEMAVRGLFATDLDHVSYLDLLFLVHAHGSINTLFSIENGAQENMVDGGVGSVAQRIADDLGEALRLAAPVRSIHQRADGVRVDAGALQVDARHAIVTAPPRWWPRSSSNRRFPPIA